jgi:hypothetical protein
MAPQHDLTTNLAAKTLAPISFSFDNTTIKGDNNAIVYLTHDPAVNKLAITLKNTGTEAFSLKGGTPPDEEAWKPGNPASLYLNFGASIPADAVKTMAFTADKWSATLLSGGWVLSPAEDISIPAGDSVTFALDNLVTEQRSPSGTLSIDYYGIGPSSPDTFQLKYFLQSPPKPGLKDLNLYLDVVMKKGNITLTPTGAEGVLNELSFTLSNRDSNAPLVGSDAPAKTATPTFLLSFVPGETPGYGSLATKGQIMAFGVKQEPVNADEEWTITAPGLDPGAELVWRLVPDSDQVLGTGTSGVVAFQISNIVSSLQPGPTLLYLQCQNIPGYNDGYFSLVINKYVLPIISKFNASPNSLKFTDKDQELPVVFSWEVKHDYTNLRIEPIYHSRVILTALEGAPVSPTTKEVSYDKPDWIMSVVDPINKHVVSKTCHLKGELMKPLLAIVEPPRLGLTVTPQQLDFSREGPEVVNLTWSTAGMQKGIFLNDESVAPTSNNFTKTVRKEELAETPSVPGIPGKVFLLKGTSLTGGKMETSLFMPRTDWPVSFPIMEKIDAAVKEVYPFSDPNYYASMLKIWKSDFLPALLSYQRSALTFGGVCMYNLKSIRNKDIYSVKALDSIKEALDVVHEKIADLNAQFKAYIQILEKFLDYVKSPHGGLGPWKTDELVDLLTKLIKDISGKMIFFEINAPDALSGFDVDGEKPSIGDRLEHFYQPISDSEKKKYVDSILASFRPEFILGTIALTVQK